MQVGPRAFYARQTNEMISHSMRGRQPDSHFALQTQCGPMRNGSARTATPKNMRADFSSSPRIRIDLRTYGLACIRNTFLKNY